MVMADQLIGDVIRSALDGGRAPAFLARFAEGR